MYWTSKKSKSVVEQRRKELDLLLEYANADLTQTKDSRLRSRIADQVCQHPALHRDNYKWMSGGAAEAIIDPLQQHLRSRLSSIIEHSDQLWEMPILRVSGTVEFAVDAVSGRFKEHFQLRKVRPGNEIKAYAKIIDLWLMEIIRDLELSPTRFGKCPRCESFFYRPTIKQKIYCSTRCADAARQAKYRQGRRAKK